MTKIRLIFAFCLTVLISCLPASPAMAMAGNQFNSGRIIDDNVFFNAGTMTPQSIQDFLNNKVPTCDTNGDQAYSGTTRRAYSQSRGYNPPYTCLKDYHADETNMSADAYCNATGGNSNVSSAQIIYDVSRACGINPQVMIVLLQKEQALVTDDWPWPTQYQKATGFGCPDTAGCDTQYAGLFNQLYYAARQFKKYQANPNVFSFAGGRTSSVQYNPNAGCGSSNIFMQTNATADLYNYTPYQPNASALNNLYGSGDGCGAYGNRNFWRYFNDWFGPTTSDSNTDIVTFIRLNHYSGNVEALGYSSISDYTILARSNLTSYPAVAPDGAVVPRFKPTNGDLSFIRLNHSSGNVEVVSYSASSGFRQLTEIQHASYPSVAPDGAVVPRFKPNGDLSFIRLNHSSGNVEIVSYSANSGYKQLTEVQHSSYPAVAADGAVIPLYTR